MGLDQYLLRKDLCSVFEDGSLCSYSSGPGHPEIAGAEAAYWRKANQIHGWFVKNVQGGVDECQDAPVTIRQLLQLVKECKQVLTCREDAPELLPVQYGFFFGNDEYDEYYWQVIESTIEQVTKALETAPENAEFVYHASW